MDNNNNSTFQRRVESEVLDDLCVDDPRAQRSRRDLQHLNRTMGTVSIFLRALDRSMKHSVPRTILELGAGDASMMLRIARNRGPSWRDVRLTLLDRLELVNEETITAFHEIGWTATVETMDVFDWLERPSVACWDLVIANLFLHHFRADELTKLLAAIARCSRTFICCEPRRSFLPLAASHMVGLLGAGPVTREDAVLSVQAGFRSQELSELWPTSDNVDWHLHEYRAGLFSHGFVATRVSVRE